MIPTIAADGAPATRVQGLLTGLRAGEQVAVAFFAYLAALAWVQGLELAHKALLPALALAILAAGKAETKWSTPATRVLRDWLSIGLIPPAYWSVGLFTARPLEQWQERWLVWDRILLNQWGLRAALESTGYLIPSVLEVIYLLLYTFPAICLGILYGIGVRERVNTYLFTLLSGTLTAYALLALLPVHGPHAAYATADLPNIQGMGRGLNLWILDHMDIATSVFPSGHVAVAFSSAVGMRRAVRSRPAIWAAMFAAAAAVYVATIYGRYHYAVDGLASMVVVGVVSLATRREGMGV